jgi:hypothetical protein
VFSYIVEWKSLVSSVFHKAKNLIMETWPSWPILNLVTSQRSQL